MLNKLRDTISNTLISLIDANLEDLPENADQFLRLAIMKHRTGDLMGAVDDLETAKSMGYNSDQLIPYIADLKLRLGIDG